MTTTIARWNQTQCVVVPILIPLISGECSHVLIMPALGKLIREVN